MKGGAGGGVLAMSMAPTQSAPLASTGPSPVISFFVVFAVLIISTLLTFEIACCECCGTW